MELLTLISIVVVVNITLAYGVKKSFGLTLVEAWPDYNSIWANALTGCVPPILWVIGMAISYFIYSLL